MDPQSPVQESTTEVTPPPQPEAGAAPKGTILLDFPVTERAGDWIGRYKLLQQIGEGGCGVVYIIVSESSASLVVPRDPSSPNEWPKLVCSLPLEMLSWHRLSKWFRRR